MLADLCATLDGNKISGGPHGLVSKEVRTRGVSAGL
jgi:hypothetical protein